MSSKILIIFAYCSTFSPNSPKNLDFFIKNALTDDKNVTFIISQNMSSDHEIVPDLPKYDNLKYIQVNVKKYAWDNWYEALGQISYQDYDYFIFIKDCIRIPVKETNEPWYIEIIKKIDEQTKMIGSEFLIIPSKVNGSWMRMGYANYLDDHKKYTIKVNTTLWSTDKIGLTFLLPYFTHKYNKREFIMNFLMIKNGYNIGSLEPRFFGLDIRKPISTEHAKKIYLLHKERDPDNLCYWTKERDKFIYKD